MRISNKNNENNYFHYNLEDSCDIIENDEYVGELRPKIKKLILHYNDQNYKSYLQNNQYQNGIVIEERNNYKFFVSGGEYSNKNISNIAIRHKYDEKQNINYYNNINLESDRLNKDQFFNYNNYALSENKKMHNKQDNSHFEKSRHNEDNNYIAFNQKSSFNFKNVGILRDSSNGKLYKIYQAIPIDINDENLEQELRKNQNHLINFKNSYGNKNNFVINRIDINKKQVNNNIFDESLIKRKNILNITKNKDNKKKIFQTIKSINEYQDTTNLFAKYNHGQNGLYQNKKIINNNNYIEINECKS